MDRMPGADSPRLFDGRYELIRRLGAGGMATVWLAEDTSLHRKVAIKVLAERYAEDEQFVERFRREAQSAAGLNHPNIVAVYDRGVSDGSYYIAMEYLDGPTLKDLIDERGGLEPKRAIGYAMQILSALRFAHNHGVVHRDIKPHNVVVAPDGRLKVTDFGIARAGTSSQMTEVGSIVGTAQYLSPEQARGEIVGPPSDLYSVGIVLYEMLTGHVPFEGDSAVAIAMKHLSEEPVPPSVYVPSTPPALEQVVMRALAKDAADRYQTAEEMGADLDRVRRGAPVSPRTEQLTRIVAPARTGTRIEPPRDGTRVWDRGEVPPRQPPPVAPVPPKRSRWPWIIVALLLLAAGAVAAVALSGALGGSGGGTTATTDTTKTTPTSATVPSDLVDQTSFKAEDELTAKGFKPRLVQLASKKQPGIVLRVNPSGGTTAAYGSTVLLYVSKGQTLVTVPKLIGTMVGDATTTLTGLKLTPAQTDSDSLQPKGTVIAQDPAQGAVVAPGSTVTLTVSSGPKPVTVPDVRGEDIATARSNLENAGLKEGTVQRPLLDERGERRHHQHRPGGQHAVRRGHGGQHHHLHGRADGRDARRDRRDGRRGSHRHPERRPRAARAVDRAGHRSVAGRRGRQDSPKAGIRPRQGSSVIVVVGQYTPPADTTTTDTTSTDTTATDTAATATTPTQ